MWWEYLLEAVGEGFTLICKVLAFLLGAGVALAAAGVVVWALYWVGSHVHLPIGA